MMSVLAILLGVFYVNASEWFMHKYILHALGRNPRSFWAYHLSVHHAVSRQNAMLDAGYRHISLTTWNTQSKELVVLAGIVLIHAPLWYYSPLFTSAVYGSLLMYYYRHRKAHLNPAWAKTHLRWHYDHHFGHQSEANWCVTWPWFDYLMGTRVKTEQSK